MKIRYTINRDVHLENEARFSPWMFAPSSFEKINSFLIGSQVFFAEEPLSEIEARRCLLLMDSYLKGISLEATFDSVMSYAGSEVLEYIWRNRRHEFHFLKASASAKIYPIMQVGSRLLSGSQRDIQIPQTTATHGFEMIRRYVNADKSGLLRSAENLYAMHLKRIFGVEGITRVTVKIHLEPPILAESVDIVP